MSTGGFILLHRSLLDNELWMVKPFGKGQAFIDLLLLAAFKDHVAWKGRLIKRGEVHTSQVALSNRWGWTRKATIAFLYDLQRGHAVTIETDKDRYNGGTRITICNYARYQDFITACSTSADASERSENGYEGRTTEGKINNKNTNTDLCGEPADAVSPPAPEAVLIFPCVGKKGQPKEWPLHQDKLDEYAAAFPGVNVLQECRALLQWTRDNPAKRKTYSGMPSFLTRNLSRKQNSGDTNGRTPHRGSFETATKTRAGYRSAEQAGDFARLEARRQAVPIESGAAADPGGMAAGS